MDCFFGLHTLLLPNNPIPCTLVGPHNICHLACKVFPHCRPIVFTMSWHCFQNLQIRRGHMSNPSMQTVYWCLASGKTGLSYLVCEPQQQVISSQNPFHGYLWVEGWLLHLCSVVYSFHHPWCLLLINLLSRPIRGLIAANAASAISDKWLWADISLDISSDWSGKKATLVVYLWKWWELQHWIAYSCMQALVHYRLPMIAANREIRSHKHCLSLAWWSPDTQTTFVPHCKDPHEGSPV